MTIRSHSFLLLLLPRNTDDSINPLVLALPLATGDPTKVTVNGASVSLEDEMGPLVVNADGSLSRISNWSEMTPIERERTISILGKRNKLRLEKLKDEQGQAGEKPA